MTTGVFFKVIICGYSNARKNEQHLQKESCTLSNVLLSTIIDYDFCYNRAALIKTRHDKHLRVDSEFWSVLFLL